jgi:hypothetical protein
MQSGVCGFSSFQLHIWYYVGQMWLQLLQGGVNDLALTRLDTQLIAVSVVRRHQRAAVLLRW